MMALGSVAGVQDECVVAILAATLAAGPNIPAVCGAVRPRRRPTGPLRCPGPSGQVT
jgi:hypothetical protein